MNPKSRIHEGDGDPRHGTVNGYVNLGCRCQPCRDAWAVSCAIWKKARQPLAPGDHRHGTENGYSNYRCRCEPCTAAHAVGDKGRYARRMARKAS